MTILVLSSAAVCPGQERQLQRRSSRKAYRFLKFSNGKLVIAVQFTHNSQSHSAHGKIRIDLDGGARLVPGCVVAAPEREIVGRGPPHDDRERIKLNS